MWPGNHLKIRQHAGESCARDSRAASSRDADFIAPELWPFNSPDFNPVDYKIWTVQQNRVYWQPVRDIDKLMKRLIDSCSRRSLMKQLISDELIWGRMLRPKADTMNICCNVLLLHCWFIDYFLTLYDVSLKMLDAILTTLISCAVYVHVCTK